MSDLSPDQFSQFFLELHGRTRYSWQIRLAARAVEGDWPRAIDLPTGSGKTACIDVAVFAMACQASRIVTERTAPRRIFFCVNRRVIVDEAYQRGLWIAKRLWDAERNKASDTPVLMKVAASLRQIAGTSTDDDAPPLDVLELRGGIYRDNRWARSAAQPTVICTTIDQLGSRLLFRGYGVSPNAAPIQAALVAYDSLVLLDEAHISRPFWESLEAVHRYLDPKTWAEESIGVRPLLVVPMTATLPDGVVPGNVIRLDEDDRKNESLNQRLTATKRASLLRVPDVTKAIVEQAAEEAKSGCVAIGIIVNRVATAKDIYGRLCQTHPDCVVELVIGAMRPIDRDEQSARLARLVGPDRLFSDETSFIVATQCLEVGADYDFDVLLTECASMDALRQRFGRLNRGGRKIAARAVIVVKDKDVKAEDALVNEKPLDPIYGNALARTWNWLWDHAEVVTLPGASEADDTTDKPARSKAKVVAETRTVDFGIDAFIALLDQHTEDGRIPVVLLAPSASLTAPVMLPAYVDFWCQTSPVPVPDPEVALFIHGDQRVEPDIQVCWRDDLLEDGSMNLDHWCDVVALLPPTSAECMSVPISRVRPWLAQAEGASPDLGDLLGVAWQAGDDSTGLDHSRVERTMRTRGVLWRGAADSKLIESPDELRPGDTLVLPVTGKGWEELGHVPRPESLKRGPDRDPKPSVSSLHELAQDIDVAEAAFQSARGKGALRLHPSRLAVLPESAGISALIARTAEFDPPPTLDELRDLMNEAAKELSDDDSAFRKRLDDFTRKRFLREPYPDRRGIVLTTRKRIKGSASSFLPSLDDGDDDTSRIGHVLLADHTGHVVKKLARTLKSVRTSVADKAFQITATLHDWGKVDERFQAMLRRTDRTDAWLFAGDSPQLLAKSDRMAQSPSERQAARERAGLPTGFRHEMLSVKLAECSGVPPIHGPERELILHLIAAHHGYARPLAPVVLDDDPPDVQYGGVELSSADRVDRPPHRLDSGVAERFWALTRRYGWWGLAYLETLLRLADQQASADEDSEKYDNEVTHEIAEANS